MKKLVVGFFILALLLTACASPTPVEQPQIPGGDSYPNPSYPSPSYPNPSYPNDGSSVGMTPAQTAALTHLSMTLNLPADQITLISTEAVTWSDGCLGVHRIDVMCTQALVEGFKFIFEADGKEYELHTNETGSAVVIASGYGANDLIEAALIKQLADNLGLNVDSISVVSSEPAEFLDSCMGVAMQDMMCAEVITPGHIIVLESDGIRYEYHVNEDGTRIQPATLALTWSRDGGIAGFCDSLTMFLSGEVYGNQCKLQDGRMETFASLLTAQERSQFNSWIMEYGQLTLDASDPKGVADGMSLVLVLYGRGGGAPNKDVEAELFTWAQDTFQELYK